jgi:hypothetical protein
MARHDIAQAAEDEILEVAEKGRRFVSQDRYVLVFGLIILTILANTFLADNFPAGRAMTLALQTVTMLVTLSTSDAGPRMRWISGIVASLAVVGILAAEIFGIQGLERVAYAATMVVLGVVTPYVIARRIASHPKITLETVSGAADIYLLIGLLFAVIFGLVGAVDAGVLHHLNGVSQVNAANAFFYSARPVNAADFLYYSFVTLTTVGYGDIVAAGQLGRMLSVVEALVGQLYLVTVVALLVSNVGQRGVTTKPGANDRIPQGETPA